MPRPRSRRPATRATLFGVALLAGLAAPAATIAAQQPAAPPSADAWLERCRRDSDWRDEDRERFCEVREYTIASAGRLDVDAGPNGGISVHGWDRKDVFVRAKVQTYAPSLDEAKALAKDLTVTASGSSVRTDGPEGRRRRGWSVSYEIWAPRTMDLDLESTNGGVNITEIRGRLRAETTNGGVTLDDVAGDVRARTTNGGVNVEVAGKQWEGTGLDVETTNGGVTLILPKDFNARLETETTNGGFSFDFPITLQGRIGRQISTTLGQGGPLVRAVTTNGGVRIRQR